ncbi:probable protein phosphatase 2C 49 [Cornus florida]|uniref:probable protein phosphatase 2C 49 n=1 Tax=Cornus florida TaxID=4283 RepID=UPI0028A25680|nr:probable protein phosphatase 2C 49 [Cornus florida]
MLVGPKMVAEAEIICQQNISVLDVQYLCSPKASIEKDLFDFSTPSSSPVFCEVRDSISIDMSRTESVVSCSSSIQTTTIVESSARKFVPSIRSGSHVDIGSRELMEDEHIRIDDLCAHLGSPFRCNMPSAFYAVFDGHGGPEAAAYVKNNAMRLFFEDASLPQTSDINDAFLEELEDSHRRAFLLADQALADEFSVSDSCGTTALTALVLGSHLLIANAGDCRAVLCRKGVAVSMSQDHIPSYLPERKRVEELGGFIECGYLNGELAVTRALGDWHMKSLHGSLSPLTAEPDIQQFMLTEEDEFLIIGCDGIWDVMSNQDAVSLVRRELRRHDDPQQCARELVNQALRLHTTDNLTAIVVCFTSPDCRESAAPQRPRFRCCSLSEEARNKLRSLLEGN